MTPEAKKRYDEKVARVEAAIALKEPDRVPMMPSAALFPMLNAGYTVAEVIYDTSLEKMTKSIVKYLNDFCLAPRRPSAQKKRGINKEQPSARR